MTNKAENVLSTARLRKGLKEHSVKSAGITLAAQVMKVGLQLVSVIVLARLLSPADFGLVAMVSIFTGLARTFMEGGLSMATIQREHVTQSQVSNLFWINCGLGLTIFLVAIALAPLVAWIYDEPRLISIMYALSLSFLIGGLSVQHDALLRRQMQFKKIAVIDLASMTIGIITAVWLAWGGVGYWSLVAMPVATMMIQTILRWVMAGWRPGMITRNVNTKPLLNFGMYLTGANFVGYFTTNVTPFLVGILGGATSLGLYNRAFAVASMPSKQVLPPIMNVMQPALARLSGEAERLRETVLSLMKKIALFTMFITLCMVTMADWLIAIFLGSGWEEAVPIFAILALSSIVTPITTFTAITLVALGEAKALMKWKIITFGILLACLSIGSIWGVMGVILAFGLSGFFIRMPLFLFYASKDQPITFSDYLKTLIPSLICTLGAGLVIVSLRYFYEPTSPYLAVLLYTTLSAVTYFSFVFAVKDMRVELLDVLKIFRIMLSKRNSPQHFQNTHQS